MSLKSPHSPVGHFPGGHLAIALLALLVAAASPAAVYAQAPQAQSQAGQAQDAAEVTQAAETIAAAAPQDEPPPMNKDPWEGWNRGVYQFNNFFDDAIVRPAARIYQTIIPRFIRRGIRNFFSNIYDINTLVNNLLQFKFDDAASDGGRLLINSTIGLGGLFDVATGMGMGKHQEDFGQTLAVWGVGPGPYVMLPVFGASSLRDAAGLAMDNGFDPVQYLEDISVRATLFVLGEVDSRERLLGLDELVVGDEYLFIREAYFQHREYLVKDGEIEDDFDDF